MPEDSKSAHITEHSTLTPTVKAWRIYLADQGNSPHTVKAFAADLRLLATFLPPDRPLWHRYYYRPEPFSGLDAAWTRCGLQS